MGTIQNKKKEEIFKYYNSLGFFNPYYLEGDNTLEFRSQISDIFKFKKDMNILNITSAVNILSMGFIIGDDTLVKSIKKSPWLAKFTENRWEYYHDIVAGEKFIEKEIIIDKFFKLLCKELLEYIGKRKNIGILLSGGMDSRIVAGILHFLIEQGELTSINVTAYTWGNLKSRDVNYARQIANDLGWDWKHVKIEAEEFSKNIDITADRGCEFSPVHLHGMASIRDESHIECIFAGSFGDSIGRGEYSGKTVVQLKDIQSRVSNKYGFFKEKIFHPTIEETENIVKNYWKLFPQKKYYQQIEQDYQIHYMRRMLNPCMAVINEKIDLFQLFTSPKIIQFMWGLHPSMRNNDIYKGILKLVHPKLSEIPWARTGLVFDRVNGEPEDNFLKSAVDETYLNIMKYELFGKIKKMVLSDQIKSLGIFNMNSLKNSFNAIKSPVFKDNLDVMAKMAWLASLSIFIDKHNVKLENSNKIQMGIIDKLSEYKVFLEQGKYSLKASYLEKYNSKK